MSFTDSISVSALMSVNSQVEAPASYWNVNDWCIGFQLLLDHLRLDKVHLFGASLGKPFVTFFVFCFVFGFFSHLHFTHFYSFYFSY